MRSARAIEPAWDHGQPQPHSLGDDLRPRPAISIHSGLFPSAALMGLDGAADGLFKSA